MYQHLPKCFRSIISFPLKHSIWKQHFYPYFAEGNRLRNNVGQSTAHMWQKGFKLERDREKKLFNQSQTFVARHQIRGLPDKLSNRQFTNVGTHFPFFHLFFIFMMEQLFLHHCAFSHQKVSSLLSLSLKAILIHGSLRFCSRNKSMCRQFFRKVYDIEFWFLKTNVVAYFSVLLPLFSVRKKASHLGTDVNLTQREVQTCMPRWRWRLQERY